MPKKKHVSLRTIADVFNINHTSWRYEPVLLLKLMKWRLFVVAGAVQPLFHQINSKADRNTLLGKMLNVHASRLCSFYQEIHCIEFMYNWTFLCACYHHMYLYVKWNLRQNLKTFKWNTSIMDWEFHEIPFIWIKMNNHSRGVSTMQQLRLDFWWINIWSKFIRNSYFERSKTEINIL